VTTWAGFSCNDGGEPRILVGAWSHLHWMIDTSIQSIQSLLLPNSITGGCVIPHRNFSLVPFAPPCPAGCTRGLPDGSHFLPYPIQVGLSWFSMTSIFTKVDRLRWMERILRRLSRPESSCARFPFVSHDTVNPQFSEPL